MYTCVYMYNIMCIHIHVYIYIYIYRERERSSLASLYLFLDVQIDGFRCESGARSDFVGAQQARAKNPETKKTNPRKPVRTGKRYNT